MCWATHSLQDGKWKWGQICRKNERSEARPHCLSCGKAPLVWWARARTDGLDWPDPTSQDAPCLLVKDRVCRSLSTCLFLLFLGLLALWSLLLQLSHSWAPGGPGILQQVRPARDRRRISGWPLLVNGERCASFGWRERTRNDARDEEKNWESNKRKSTSERRSCLLFLSVTRLPHKTETRFLLGLGGKVRPTRQFPH